MKEPEGSVTLSLNEVEVFLLATEPRSRQDLGPFYNKAKAKLMKLRNELKEQARQQAELFT